MITLTTAQLNAWIVAFIYPTVRVLALVSTAPFLSNAALPRRTRLIFGLAVSIALIPTLPAMPRIAPDSGLGVAMLAQQVLIGVAMGFSMRVVFAGVEMAGFLVSSQMGLGFATNYDPQSAANTAVVSEFFTLLATMIFLSMNGHLLYIAALAQSFATIPVAPEMLGAGSWLALAKMGSKIFMIGVMLALPAVVALLITNMALGVLNRAAPQLNLFAIGFPITLSLGFIILSITLNYMATPLQAMFEQGLSSMLGFAQR